MKNIIFIGGFYSDKLLRVQRKHSKGKITFANHNFEMSLVSGLLEQKDINLSIITAPGVGSYPHNNTQLFTYPDSFELSGCTVKSIGFCNLLVLNKLDMMYGILKELYYTIKKYNHEDVYLVVNTATVYLMFAVAIVRLFHPKQLNTTLIIPDIPSMMTSDSNGNSIKMKIRKQIDKIGMRLMRKYDNYVLLSKQMLDFLPINSNHIVMDGIINPAKMDSSLQTEFMDDMEIILYTGSIQVKYGIMNLVNAFDLLEHKNVELWICGAGDAKNEIEKKAAENPSIKFFGLVDSEKAWLMQRQATVLVNPRTNDGEYTKYSFPSKTMEYLLSGKSVIMNRLPSIHEEYFEYAFAPQNETVEELAHTIDIVLAMDKKTRQDRAKRGKEFIINQKNSKVQVSRIMQMLN